MQTRVPTSGNGQTSSPRSRRIWPWAAGSIAIPLIVIAATLFGARYAARRYLATQVAPAPQLPPLRVQSVIQPEDGVGLWTLAVDPRSHPVIAAYSYGEAPACVPGSSCVAPNVNQLTLFPTGSPAPQGQLARGVTPTDVSACSLLADTAHGALVLVCPGQVQVDTADTELTVNQFSLPAGLDTAHASLDSNTNTLYLTGSSALHAYDLTSGAQIATQQLNGSLSAPIVDPLTGRVYVLENGGSSQPILLGFQMTRARALQQLGAEKLPTGWRAGPADSVAQKLFIFGPADAVAAVDLGAFHLPTATGAPLTPPAALTTLAPLKGALALGFDNQHQILVALYADRVVAFDYELLRPYAEAPVAGAWDAQRPLPVDVAGDIAYIPDDSGAVVALSLARTRSFVAPDADTAELLARAGLGKLLPDTNQTPPFLIGYQFPLVYGSPAKEAEAINLNFAIPYTIPYVGVRWQGPFPGTTRAAFVRAGSQSGDYTFRFDMTWNQQFVHTHSWTVELLADGRVKMLSDTGDQLPNVH
jgi:hypothetical protein